MLHGNGNGRYYMRKTNRLFIILILSILSLISYAEEVKMDTTNLENYLQSRGDMTKFDIEKFKKCYGNSAHLKLNDGTFIDVSDDFSGVDESHYLAHSSYNNWYRYDENGHLQLMVNYYGNIELHRTTYDSSGNVLTEERGDVYDAPFSLDDVKALMKRVYDVDLDTLTSKDNPEYRWGKMQFYYNTYQEKYLYFMIIAPPEASGAVRRDLVIDAETGEVTLDELIYAED